jgi:hypothetical protein
LNLLTEVKERARMSADVARSKQCINQIKDIDPKPALNY